MCTPAKVEYAVSAQSTLHRDGTYVVHTSVDIDGLSLTKPSYIGLLKEAQRMHKILLHFSYVAQWESF
jgi:hypothetical protein